MLRYRRNPFVRTTKPLKKIGFFHFGSSQTKDPVGSLRAALLTKGQNDLRNSLIVVPEAFNLCGGYHEAGRQIDPRIFGSLAQMSAEFEMAFVAGLIEPPGTSSAYLIDGQIQNLLSRKMKNDRSGNYHPAAVNCDAVVQHRGLCLGALICMDAAGFSPFAANARHQQLLSQFYAAKLIPPILCIPACMGSYSSEAIVKAWPAEIITIVSNSSASQPSIMRIGETLISIKPSENVQNVIHLADIPKYANRAL